MNKVVQTILVCPECGNKFPIMRKVTNQRKLFHIKDLYCPFCRKITKHIEGKDLDLLLSKIENTPEEERKTEESFIYQLVKRKEK